MQKKLGKKLIVNSCQILINGSKKNMLFSQKERAEALSFLVQ